MEREELILEPQNLPIICSPFPPAADEAESRQLLILLLLSPLSDDSSAGAGRGGPGIVSFEIFLFSSSTPKLLFFSSDNLPMMWWWSLPPPAAAAAAAASTARTPRPPPPLGCVLLFCFFRVGCGRRSPRFNLVVRVFISVSGRNRLLLPQLLTLPPPLAEDWPANWRMDSGQPTSGLHADGPKSLNSGDALALSPPRVERRLLATPVILLARLFSWHTVSLLVVLGRSCACCEQRGDDGDLEAAGNLEADGDLNAEGDLNPDGDLEADDDLQAENDLEADGDLQADGDLEVDGDLEATRWGW